MQQRWGSVVGCMRFLYFVSLLSPQGRAWGRAPAFPSFLLFPPPAALPWEEVLPRVGYAPAFSVLYLFVFIFIFGKTCALCVLSTSSVFEVFVFSV